MKEPQWTRTLSEVLGYQTQTITKKSLKTGNTYQTEAISQLELVVTGDPEKIERDNRVSYRYSDIDMKKNMGYKITSKNFVKICGMKHCILTKNVGGALSNGKGWYKADSVALAVASNKA